ncbi:NAD(P)-dependent dehydrogenase (short-subunit alcohol dehydrogenase family) [Lachnotalea glycerini]|uniref:NAD(P)-dependent dehydrogenase (Short-subunit alcohol dehydrogenase family) n=1 Tax=Lachnotalea glycerini TaxID=1763509 RepID=A0A255ISC3_9FIRM|nr:glucose 1-dehydrogenase [Lachnotalea glycerini]OYO51578.1 short-chain dehydrogenase [Lachnotalea glycerini]PXV87722.1 NAD(P)-dependent dehydrogenase (short-subunit alcohol dehydrogenase family) [Lachnotalea glycerini]RDY32106.1 SDR family oxidoreductase [Lachnotalea glycerini]
MGIIERMRLDGKVSFITGGARGIGKAIATAIAEAGSDVAIIDLDMEEAEKTAKEIEMLGVKAIAIQADVTKEEEVDHMMQIILDTFGKLDVAFCNAGICMNIPADEMTYEQWKKVIDINLNGIFLSSQAAAKVMLKQKKGSIINTASMSGHIVNVPQPQCSYNASKAGVIMLTKSMAVEFAKKGVRVNSISPGYIGTELTLQSPTLKPLIEQWNEMAPLGRMGRPDELQAIAVYLAGDTSDFTTGSDFVIDGAFTCF